MIDVVQYIQRQKWRWIGQKDNRWNKRCTEWQPKSGKRDRGRPEARWMDDIRRTADPLWQRKAQDLRKWKTLCRGLHPAVMDKSFKEPINKNKLKSLHGAISV
ncbi:endonuclease-reverse transcriptase [Plakobranchus ocellatus]|uniref:Endonuclease-reverse transcriptase n=1 Tax=Plakobranchus ocellatus TaxID=259542 RepID=A0AAV3Y867_9GAST|nr:endonuclease-reverse transcriptase [Plakobranchus ocellatus]